jgi:hypothetical protein
LVFGFLVLGFLALPFFPTSMVQQVEGMGVTLGGCSSFLMPAVLIQ